MIWGEPTRGDSFGPMPPNAAAGPRAYARLLDAAYGALKRERRSNIVIGGMTWTVGKVTPRDVHALDAAAQRTPAAARLVRPQPVLRPLPPAEQAPLLRPASRDFSDVDTLYREVRRAYPRRRPRLWLSEFTVSARRANRAFSFLRQRARAGAVGARGVPDRVSGIASSPGSAGTRCSTTPTSRTA